MRAVADGCKIKSFTGLPPPLCSPNRNAGDIDDERDMKPNLLLRTGLAPLLADRPLTTLDVGSRGGMDPDLLSIAGVVDAVGFEPEPVAFAALSARDPGPWRSLRYLPYALAGSEGERTLHVPEDPEGASLLRHDTSFAEAFGKRQFFHVTKTVSVRTRLLDNALREAGVAPPAYLKLDVEGTELEILESAPETLRHLLAIKAEVSFVPFRHGQPLAGDVEAFLRRHGFVLMDIVRPHRWRIRGNVIHPQAAAQAVPYSRGQLMQGDFLFFRQPETVDSAERRLQAAALAMSWGYFDHAGRLLLEPSTAAWLRSEYDCHAQELLDRCSRAYGRAVWLAEVSRHLRLLITFGRSLKALWGSRAEDSDVAHRCPPC